MIWGPKTNPYHGQDVDVEPDNQMICQKCNSDILDWHWSMQRMMLKHPQEEQQSQ